MRLEAGGKGNLRRVLPRLDPAPILGLQCRLHDRSGQVFSWSREGSNRLYWEDFKRTLTLGSPSNEQIWIADAIDRTAKLTSTGIRNLQRQINAANEFRTRLIGDVTTGKVDVREAAAKLPEPNPITDGNGNETVQARFNPRFSNSALEKEADP